MDYNEVNVQEKFSSKRCLTETEHKNKSGMWKDMLDKDHFTKSITQQMEDID